MKQPSEKALKTVEAMIKDKPKLAARRKDIALIFDKFHENNAAIMAELRALIAETERPPPEAP